VRRVYYFVCSMARNIAVAFAPIVYYATCVYETVTDFVEAVIERIGCRTYLWLVYTSIIQK